MRGVAGGSDQDALLTEVRAADLLSLSVRTLQAWRARGFGPPYVRAGRAVRYRRHDLLAWTEACVVYAEGPRSLAVQSKVGAVPAEAADGHVTSSAWRGGHSNG
jgi:hypothetical protein